MDSAFHVACKHCSPVSLLWLHPPRIYRLQTPSPGPAFAVKWWGMKPRKAKIRSSCHITWLINLFLFPHQKIELTFLTPGPVPARDTKTKQGAKEQQNERSENWICFILAIRITLRLWTIFSWTWISLQISLQKNSRMSNQKTEYVLSLSLGILDCNTEMGNEITFYPANSWVLLNQLLNCNFRQH